MKKRRIQRDIPMSRSQSSSTMTAQTKEATTRTRQRGGRLISSTKTKCNTKWLLKRECRCRLNSNQRLRRRRCKKNQRFPRSPRKLQAEIRQWKSTIWLHLWTSSREVSCSLSEKIQSKSTFTTQTCKRLITNSIRPLSTQTALGLVQQTEGNNLPNLHK